MCARVFVFFLGGGVFISFLLSWMDVDFFFFSPPGKKIVSIAFAAVCCLLSFSECIKGDNHDQFSLSSISGR